MIKTKFLAVPLVVFFIAAFSFNANSEVLIYKWKLAGTQNLSLNNGETYTRTVLIQNGYFVVNFVPATGLYSNPWTVKYWNQVGKKYSLTDTFLNGAATFEAKTFSNQNYVMISGFVGKDRAEMYSGRSSIVSAAQAGGGNALNISRSLKGNAVWDESGAQIILSSGRGNTFMQLDISKTRNANFSGQTVAQVVADLENELAAKGYARQSPFAQDDNATTDMNKPVNISVLANDYDVNLGATLTVTAIQTAPVNGAAVINADSTITYTPKADWFGLDTFIYTMQSSTGLTDSANVVVNVKYPYSTEIVSGDLGVFNAYMNSISRDGKFVAFAAADAVTTGALEGLAVQQYDRGTETLTECVASYAGVQGVSPIGKIISDTGTVVPFHSADFNLVLLDLNRFVDVFVSDTGTVTRVSLTTGGAESNGNSYNGVISADGNQVAFYSYANNLVPGDNNIKPDVFVRSRLAPNSTALMSQSTAGVIGNGISQNPSISADGQYVAFESNSTNLAAGADNGKYQIFFHNRDVTNSGTFDTPGNTSTILISRISGAGLQGDGDSFTPYIGGNDVAGGTGMFVVYSSSATNLDSVTPDTNNVADIFLYNVNTGFTTRISFSTSGTQANGPSGSPQITEDGVYAIFRSDATNLVSGDLNGMSDIFIRDLVANSTNLVTVNGQGDKIKGDSRFPSVGTDGNYLYISYSTNASDIIATDVDNLYDIYVQRRKDIYK